MISPVILFLAAVGFSALWICAMFSIYIIINIFKAKRLPMDTSNRINHIRLVWFAVTRPELFVGNFEWLKRDELDNLK